MDIKNEHVKEALFSAYHQAKDEFMQEIDKYRQDIPESILSYSFSAGCLRGMDIMYKIINDEFADYLKERD